MLTEKRRVEKWIRGHRNKPCVLKMRSWQGSTRLFEDRLSLSSSRGRYLKIYNVDRCQPIRNGPYCRLCRESLFCYYYLNELHFFFFPFHIFTQVTYAVICEREKKASKYPKKKKRVSTYFSEDKKLLATTISFPRINTNVVLWICNPKAVILRLLQAS